jgi:DNA-binding transcriptional MerR regulator
MSQSRFRFPAPPSGVDIDALTITQVCNLAVTTKRRVRYLVSIGAISPPRGNTKAARYTWGHVQTIRSLNAATRKGEITAREAAEVRTHGIRKANGRPHVEGTSIPPGGTRVEHVYQLTSQLRLVAPSDLSPVQRGILERVLQAARLKVSEQGAAIREYGKALDAAQKKEDAKKARAAARRKAAVTTPSPDEHA